MVDIFASVHSAGPQTCTTGTTVKLTGLTLDEVTPTGSPSPWHNGNSRFEIATGWDGLYQLNARGQWDAAFNQSCLLQARINGSTLVNLFQGPGSPDTSGAVVDGFAGSLRLTAGDYVDIRVRQASGSNKAFQLDEATLQWVRA